MAKKKGRGQPTKYKEEFPEQAARLAILGLTNEGLAKYFDVSLSTIGKWIAEIPEFSDALKKGRVDADADVAESLYSKAISGDVTACIFWLKNRRPDLWRDKHDVNTSVDLGDKLQDLISKLPQ